MMDAVIDEVQGRRIRIGDHWLCDFASCNYLGFDLHPEIIASVSAGRPTLGHPPQLVPAAGQPAALCRDRGAAHRTARGARHARTAHDHAHPHLGDPAARRSGGRTGRRPGAQDDLRGAPPSPEEPGATLHRVRANDPEHLEQLLRSLPSSVSKVFCIDGVNSMTGNAPDLPLYARICRDYDALLYVDDAHGFGIVGESPTKCMPYGYRGNSIVRFYDESYENLVLVAGFSKSYSSLAAFLALPTSLKNYLKVAAPPYLYSGPSPTASLATVLAGFDVNDAEGDDIRRSLCHKTHRVLDQIAKLGLRTLNTSGYPVIELPLGNADDIDAVGKFLFERGIYVTLAPYPLVPRAQVGFRVQVTAANDDSQIDQLNERAGRAVRTFRHAAGR